MKKTIKQVISEMTLDEKAALCSGANSWETKETAIGKIIHSDGPYGIRREAQDADGNYLFNQNLPSVCYPASVTAASSFDVDLIEEEGKILGKQCCADGVDILLGPGVNIKRSPLCGRNFEYYSEDPYLASHLGAAYIKGVQSQGVGTSLKHFLANNQETARMSVSSDIDERTLREIYLAAFEYAVKEGKPWTVMASYNKINGTYSTENKVYNDILRSEWGFDGYIVSDWGATHNRVKAVLGGTDLTMPSAADTDHLLVEAVKEGRIEESVLDTACERILTILERTKGKSKQEFDLNKGHAFAQRLAEEGSVLLKNEGVLPISENAKVAFIGYFAKNPRIMGGGSSNINACRIEAALDAAAGYNVTYAQGYELSSNDVNEAMGYDVNAENDASSMALEEEAIRIAKESDVAVIFAGLPESWESEGFDRTKLDMPSCQNRLIEKIAAVNKSTVVVLHNGAPIIMPWLDKVQAVIEVYLGGQAVGAATVNLLYGKINPSGRLAESFPKRLEDNPSYLFYFGENDHSAYREGIFIGYRYYTKKKIETLFPFGFGLSYTQFEYSNLCVDREELDESQTVKASVNVRNAGKYAGKEVVQLYVAANTKGVIRPVRELKGFQKISLAPGEEKTVTFTLDCRAFAYWNEVLHDWQVVSGDYMIEICKNAEEVICQKTVRVNGKEVFVERFTLETKIEKLLKTEKGMAFWEKTAPLVAKYFMTAYGASMSEEDAIASMMDSQNPILQGGLGGVCGMLQDPVIYAGAQTLFDELNEEYQLN